MTLRGTLLRELQWVCQSSARLLLRVDPADLDWRPGDGLRSLREQGHHLAQLPAVDMVVMRGLSEDEVAAEEDKLTARAEEAGLPAGWEAVLREGTGELSRFIEKLPAAEFETGSGSAYYGRTQTYAQWLMETIGSVYHHRAVLYTSLKLRGYDISSRALYD